MTTTRYTSRVAIWLIILITVLGSFYIGYQLFQPKNQSDIKEEVIVIKSGRSLGSIATSLEEKNLIRNSFIFKLYLKIRGLEKELKAGYYRLNSGMSMLSIIDKLIKGETANYKFTIPEGMTVEEIGTKLTKYDLDRGKFLQLVKKGTVKWLSRKKKILYNLEGFLFPETYHLPYGSSEQEIIEIMLQQFKEKITDLEPQIKESKYSLRQIITIASLVQGEAKLKEDMRLIASVIYNRLELGMKLQLDATVQYALEERKSRLLYSDLEVDSYYNTYQYFDLPPGPINNPGLAAIKATLDPADTDYLYYVATKDGKHKFTKTYQQHLKVQERLKED
ncbi:endolytic transglycosylase MltG [Halanaerocella petrolearia]